MHAAVVAAAVLATGWLFVVTQDSYGIAASSCVGRMRGIVSERSEEEMHSGFCNGGSGTVVTTADVYKQFDVTATCNRRTSGCLSV